ncbi:unnamed protein product [Protopolystoma xenopodis]|uniref:Uncharacterized protein n=1 Tax=Protopolystoma xenopodis TaxID=117903 RepID=A0A448WQM9_9PLAT|nr:unnamed protein product [Protopolystoma xenopodis]
MVTGAEATCSSVRCLSANMTCRMSRGRQKQPLCLDCSTLPNNCEPLLGSGFHFYSVRIPNSRNLYGASPSLVPRLAGHASVLNRTKNDGDGEVDANANAEARDYWTSMTLSGLQFGAPLAQARPRPGPEWPPVCTTDDLVLPNACLLHVLNCLTETSFRELRQPGFC